MKKRLAIACTLVIKRERHINKTINRFKKIRKYKIFQNCDIARMASGFISENVLEEKRRQRQEEWEKVRKPEDPEKAPEEPQGDPR